MLCVLRAAALRLAIDLLVPGVVTSTALFPAVLAAFVGGTGPWLLTLASSGLLAWHFLLRPKLGFYAPSPGQATSLVFYLISAGLILANAAALRRALLLAEAERVRQQLLAAELSHLVKNLLAVVQSITARSDRGGRA